MNSTRDEVTRHKAYLKHLDTPSPKPDVHIQTIDGYSYHLTSRALKQKHNMCLASVNPHK